MNFLVGRWLKRQPTAAVLWAGLAFNLALLAVFKYIPGIAVSIPVATLQKFSHLALPLGISFWTFQAMSYLLDLYRGEELDPSFVEFALYMAFFPVTISGPICRMPEMLPQFRSEKSVSRHDIGRGLCRVATGVLMMQLAQLLGKGILGGEGINGGFDHLTRWSGLDVWCLAFGYGLQLFFDFAGYSHVAIGAAQMLGFTVPENFARPFASTTRRSSGPAGTCRSRFGFATTCSFLWRFCDAKCGGETWRWSSRWSCSDCGTREVFCLCCGEAIKGYF